MKLKTKQYSDVEDLQITLKQAASCLKGVQFKETKCGGVVQKGNRKLAVTVSPYVKFGKFKIRKGKKGGYFLGVNRLDTASYYDIKDEIKKGLKA